MPRVSVILPVYNGMPYLQQAVGSILGQTFRDLELVLIDDVSTDETAAYLSGLVDPRVPVIHFLRGPTTYDSDRTAEAISS